jgi:transposase
MSLRPQPLPPVPAATTAAVHAAFPKGNLYVELRAEFGTLYDDQLFADLYPSQGRPVEVAPWRLALVMVMQYIKGSPTARRPMPSAAAWIGSMRSALP